MNCAPDKDFRNGLLAFRPLQREEIPFVGLDLVSRNAFEYLTDLFWSETLNYVKPAA